MPYGSDLSIAADLVGAVSTYNAGAPDDNAGLEYATSLDFPGTSDFNFARSVADGYSSLGDVAGAVMAAAGSGGGDPRRSLYQRSGFQFAPWIWAPEAFISFSPLAALNTPVVDGNDYVVLTLVVPPGYDGVIKRMSHNYNGGGFQEGSGFIVWRLLVDNQAMRNFDSMLVSFGTPQTPRELDGGIRIYSGQTIQYVVNLPLGSGFVPSGGTQIICGLSGWFYPRQTA